MDFVVVGLGVGALAILLGLTIRDAGSRWWSIRAEPPLPPQEQARRLAIGRAGRAGGYVLSLAGAVIVLATIVAIALSLSDRAGAILVMAVISIAALGCVAWGMVYAHRYHPRPRPRPPVRRPAVDQQWEAAPSLAGTIDAAFAHRDAPPEPAASAEDLTEMTVAGELAAADVPLADLPGDAQAAGLAQAPPDTVPAAGASASIAATGDALAATEDTIAATDDRAGPDAASVPTDQTLEPGPDSSTIAPPADQFGADAAREQPAGYAARKDQGA